MGDRVYALGTDKRAQWIDVLDRCECYDVYHLVNYHRLAEERGEGRAALFVFETGSIVIAFPFLLKTIEDVPGVDSSNLHDAHSVYGYPGPILSHHEMPQDTIDLFQEALRDYFVNEGIISVFSRLNPILRQSFVLHGFNGGNIVETGPTASIDLTQSPEHQQKALRSGHSHDIKKAKERGVECFRDDSFQYLDSFIDIYYETMQLKGAGDTYFFDRTYFHRLAELLEGYIHLFVAVEEGRLLSAALFTLCEGIIQYHLAGTNPAYRDVAASKLIIDTVRQWGNDQGAQVFHLGGGVGGNEDGVYRFKTGFADTEYRFKVWQAVIDQEAYDACLHQREDWERAQGREIDENTFFPAYRAPSRPIDSP